MWNGYILLNRVIGISEYIIVKAKRRFVIRPKSMLIKVYHSEYLELTLEFLSLSSEEEYSD